MFDVINAVGLTVVAAVLVAILATVFGTTSRGRTTIAAALGAWFVLLALVGANGLLDAVHGIGMAGFAIFVSAPLVVLSALAMGTEAGRARIANAPLPILVGSQTIRLVGICFVLLYAANRLPAPFAPLAGWGDVVIGGLAPLVALATVRAPIAARTSILAWNTLGLLDMGVAMVLGVAAAPGPTQIFDAVPDTQIMTSLPWIFIPCFLVPVDALVHLMIYAKMGAKNAARPNAVAFP